MGTTYYLTLLRKIAYNTLPERLLHALENQKSGLEIQPYFIINNLPIDYQINGSPDFFQTGANFKSGHISENILCMIGAILGEPYSIFFEGQELVNNLTPHPDTKNQYTGLGSEVELDLHVENSALRFLDNFDYSPLGLLLFGVRDQVDDDGGPYTNVADSRLALNQLNSEEIELLKSNNYIIKLPYRWRQAFAGINDCTDPCPMISGDNEVMRVNAVFYPDMVTSLNKNAEKALGKFYNELRGVMVKINITPGKLVYVDNRIALHSRDKFTARYDKNGCAYRWIQRLFIMSNLWPLKNFDKVGHRIFNPTIKVNFYEPS